MIRYYSLLPNPSTLIATSVRQILECLIHFIGGNPVSLVCTNINSMMGGRSNIWESGRDKDIGLVDAVGKTITKKDAKFKNESNPSDDILEFEIMSSVINLALGKANRVA